jgi:hypothetical protein
MRGPAGILGRQGLARFERTDRRSGIANRVADFSLEPDANIECSPRTIIE